MAYSISDAFAYSNGGLGTVSSAIWTDCSIGTAIPVVSGQLVGASSVAAAVRTSWLGSTALQYSEIAWASGQYGGPTILSDSGSAHYLLELTLAGSANGEGAAIIEEPGYVQLAFVARTLIAGHVFRLRMETAGTLIGSDNGTDFVSVAGEFTITSGKPGVRVYSATLDSWVGGDFSSGGGGPLVGGSLVGRGRLGGVLVS